MLPDCDCYRYSVLDSETQNLAAVSKSIINDVCALYSPEPHGRPSKMIVLNVFQRLP